MASFFSPETRALAAAAAGFPYTVDDYRRTDYARAHSQGTSKGSINPFEASIEQARGASFSPSARPQQRPPALFEEPDAEEEYEDVDSMLVGDPPIPLREYRKIPGCGVNQYDSTRESVRCDTSPVRLDELFGPEIKVYKRTKPIKKPPLMACYGMSDFVRRGYKKAAPALPASATLMGSQSQGRELNQLRQQMIHDPRYPPCYSPLSTSSSSSSSSSSGSSIGNFSALLTSQERRERDQLMQQMIYHPRNPRGLSPASFTPPSPASSSSIGNFQPMFQSSFMQTPPYRRVADPHRASPLHRHPAYSPSFNVLPGEGYHPSSTSSGGSDRSVFSPTPPTVIRRY